MTESNNAPKRYYGRYRGTVVNNVDCELKGRLLCMVPDVLGPVPSSWCEPSPALSGVTGTAMGSYTVPTIGAGVWVEFEQGDPNRPIWSGCRVAAGDPPAMAYAGLPVSPSIVFQTAGQNSLSISDGADGIIIRHTRSGATLMINDTGIIIQNGKGASIALTGPSIFLNIDALTILK